MDFMEVVRRRRSVRAFRNDAVTQEELEQILEAARLAPTAVNYQPFTFIVLRGDEVKKLENTYSRDWFLEAPAVIVVCCNHENSWKRKDGKDFGDIDAAIAMDHIILAATNLGLGTCWIGAFNREQASHALNLPSNIEPVVMTPVGHPAHIPDAKPRKTLDELVRWGGCEDS